MVEKHNFLKIISPSNKFRFSCSFSLSLKIAKGEKKKKEE